MIVVVSLTVHAEGGVYTSEGIEELVGELCRTVEAAPQVVI